MTDTIYSKMKINLENIDIKNSEESFFWDNDILRLFQVDLASLSIEDLPAEKIDENIYKSLDDFEKSHIKIKFMSSKSYLWLKNILNESESSEMYFGQLTQALHNILESDMKHYRSEVKERLNILLCWISVLCEDEFTIDIPNYSTRIRLN